MAFLWIKALHIIAVISWMAGLFYLPRLFVYHCRVQPGSEADGLFKIMERRLMAVIIRPASVVTVVAGILTVNFGGMSFAAQWLTFKLVGVAALIAYQFMLERHLAEFRRDERLHDERYFRLINEIPTLLLVWIVIFVVVKPFT
jgi:putative membrane protein